MEILNILEDAELVIVDLELQLGDSKQSSPTLCVKYNQKIIPLSTSDSKPIIMNSENAIELPL
tara:strand:- start:230 stop:418 length:189 start_codon:yes stop_codon:yes gene_type:complete